jgi:hypothetical protein
MKRAIGALVTVLIGVAIFVAVGFGFRAQKYESVAPRTKAVDTGTTQVVHGETLKVYTLDLYTYPDSTGTFDESTGAPAGTKPVPIHKNGNPGWPAYGPSNDFEIPQHALIKVHWEQRDSGEVLNNPWFAKPTGTVGPVTLNGKTVPASGIDPNNVGHTFTVRPEPGVDRGFFLNVAAPANPGDPDDTTKPQVMEFSFVSGKKGLYAWNCEFPCGNSIGGFGAVMSAYGFMSGYVYVV